MNDDESLTSSPYPHWANSMLTDYAVMTAKWKAAVEKVRLSEFDEDLSAMREIA